MPSQSPNQRKPILRARDPVLALGVPLVLLAATNWLFQPFLSGRLLGSGDARWYVQMLADYLEQARHTFLPVGAGATSYAFNGAVYPLRAAPFYQHFGGLIDLLTGFRLNAVRIHGLELALSGMLGVLSAYFAALTILPGRRLVAALLAWVYLTCPGVLALSFSQDLIMSWMVLPFLPWVWTGLVLLFREFDFRNLGRVALGLAGLWLCHAPIASGMTLVAVAGVLWAHGWRRPSRSEWRAFLFWGVVLAAAVSFPFISLAAVRAGDGAGLIPYSVDRTALLVNIRAVFPAILLPLSVNGMELGDVQLGYALLVFMLAALGALLTARQRLGLFAASVVATAAVLLLPIPGLTAVAWRTMPESLATLAYIWPMHRFYLPLAGFTVAIAAVACGQLRETRARWTVVVMLGLGAGWSTYQAHTFVAFAPQRTASAADEATSERPENRMLMVHSYGMFSRRSEYFSDGVMDPLQDLRLFAEDGRTQILKNDLAAIAERTPDESGPLSALRDANPGIWNLQHDFVLVPAHRLFVELDFTDPKPEGIFLVQGDGFSRVYSLADAGGTLAYGSGGLHSHILSLWTSAAEPVRVRIRYIPPHPEVIPAVVARYRDWSISESQLPIALRGWTPLVLAADLPRGGWLETPRMLTNGYSARVNGQPAAIRRSVQGQVMVHVPAGRSHVEVQFRMPMVVMVAYAACLAAWAAGLTALALTWRRSGR